jgi:hypothetical protein
VALSRNGREELSPFPKALRLFPPLPGAVVPAEFRQKPAHRAEPNYLRLPHQRRNYFILIPIKCSSFDHHPFRHILSVAQEKNGSLLFFCFFTTYFRYTQERRLIKQIRGIALLFKGVYLFNE